MVFLLYLCNRLAALGKLKTSFLSTRLRNLCISKQECGVSARTDRGAVVEYIELLLL